MKLVDRYSIHLFYLMLVLIRTLQQPHVTQV